MKFRVLIVAIIMSISVLGAGNELSAAQRACATALASGNVAPRAIGRVFLADLPPKIANLYRGVLAEGYNFSHEDVPAVREFSQNVLNQFKFEDRQVIYSVLKWPPELKTVAEKAVQQKQSRKAEWEGSAIQYLDKALYGTFYTIGALATIAAGTGAALFLKSSSIEEDENEKNFAPFLGHDSEEKLIKALRASPSLNELPDEFIMPGAKYRKKIRTEIATGAHVVLYELVSGNSQVKQIQVNENRIKNLYEGYVVRLHRGDGTSYDLNYSQAKEYTGGVSHKGNDHINAELYLGIFSKDKNVLNSLVPPMAKPQAREATEFDKQFSKHIKLKASGVAVMDTGIDYTRGDLMGASLFNEKEIPNNNVDDDGNKLVDDYLGYDFQLDSPITHSWPSRYHGSSVSEVVSKASQKVRVLPLKMVVEMPGQPAGIKKSIEYIRSWNEANPDRPVRVVNMSFTMKSVFQTELIQAIRDNPDLFFVAAAGNKMEGKKGNHAFPGEYSFPNLFNVGAVYTSGNLSPFSGSGPNVDLVDEGSFLSVKDSSGAITAASGTSYSSPAVAALIAELVLLRPDITAAQLNEVFEKASMGYVEGENMDSSEQSQLPTKGRVNKTKAYQLVLDLPR